MSDKFEARLDDISRAAAVLLSECAKEKEISIAVVSPLVTLIAHGVTALTEIAQSQARLVELAEADIAATVEQMAGERADELAREKAMETMKRSFIGQNKSSA